MLNLIQLQSSCPKPGGNNANPVYLFQLQYAENAMYTMRCCVGTRSVNIIVITIIPVIMA